MLWASLADFHAWGDVRTVTTLDARLKNLTGDVAPDYLPVDEIIWVDHEDYPQVFDSLVQKADAVLITAPETDGILARLSATCEAQGAPLLGSSSLAVSLAADKAACYRVFQDTGLPIPHTLQTNVGLAEAAAGEIGYPLVVKPLDGVGCEGVSLVSNPEMLARALVLLREASQHEEILLQNYLEGTHASVSLLATKEAVVPLSLNGQQVEPGLPFSYHGGRVPLDHPAKARAFELAQAAVRLIPGLCGYLGVDMVLTAREAYLIEINPRLTTSYIGLRQVLPFNLAQAIWSACKEGTLPGDFVLTGSVSFSKENARSWGLLEHGPSLGLHRKEVG